MKTKPKHPVFKQVNQNQQMLLPPSLQELIDKNHPVRIVNNVIDKIDLKPLYDQYDGGGASSYDPRMMLKILIYAYLNNVYSSRKIEEKVSSDIHYMWLAGMAKPSHNSINRFRGERIKNVLKQLFSEIVILLNREKILCIKDLYTDGTKIEANANKYTFVWGKAIQTRRKKIAEQIDELWRYAETITKEELTDTHPTSYKEINPETVAETINKLDEYLKDYKIDTKIRQKIRRVKKTWPEQLRKYEEQEKKLNGRNSYSKTDEDATFMRMKEDHMQNGQLKAGYNVQISTNNQFIVNYTLHQTPGDTKTLINHVMQHFQLYGQMPEELTADAGYGSEENYEFAKENNIDAYVKYNNFHKEETKKWKRDISRPENLYYDEDLDRFYCPMGQPMDKIEEYTKENESGYIQTISRYTARDCSRCPLRGACHKGKGNRIMEVNQNARSHRKKMKEKLASEKGLEKRSQRPVDVETVFGNIKQNKGFKRFMLRGLEKVEIEFGLLAIGHNLAKFCTIKTKNLFGLENLILTFITVYDNAKNKIETYLFIYSDFYQKY